MLGLQTAVVIDCHSGHTNTRLRDLLVHDISSPGASVWNVLLLADLPDTHSSLGLQAYPSAGQHGLYSHTVKAVEAYQVPVGCRNQAKYLRSTFEFS